MRRPRRRQPAWDERLTLLREPDTQPMGAYHPAPVGPAPPRTSAAAGRGWSMIVNEDAPGIPMDARLRKARAFLELEVADYAAQGMLYRIDDAAAVRQRGEDLDDRSVVAITVAKAVRHLMGPRQPWSAA